MAKDAVVRERRRPTPEGDELRSSATPQARTAPNVIGEGLQIILEPLEDLTQAGLVPAEGLFFQCPPLEEFTIEHNHTFTDYDTPRLGQMSRKGGRQLITATFDTLVVDWGTYTLLDVDVEIEDFTDKLRRINRSGTPFLFTAAHQQPPGGYQNWTLTLGGPELQMAATLRALRITERAGEGDARYLNCAFVEYRDPVVGERELGKAPRRGGKKFPVTGQIDRRTGVFRYVPKGGSSRIEVRGRLKTDGDPLPTAVTLADLAQHFYGNPGLARHIALANGLTDWGQHSSLYKHPRWRNGGSIKIPARPGSGR